MSDAPPSCSIPLVDLHAQHEEIKAEVADGIDRVMASGSFIGGDEVTAFEQAFATFANVSHCIGVANGTDALELLLRALDIGPGYEVVLPANTFVATAEAVVRAGACVRLADCDESTLLLDPEATADAVTSRTAALLPVHLHGQLAPMSELAALAQSRGLGLIEDAAQCQGATQAGEVPGSFGAGAAT